MPPGPARQPILGEGGPGRTSRRHGRDRIGTGRAGSPGPFFTSGPGSLGARPCLRLPGRHFARLLPGEDWQPMPPPVWKACGKRIGRPCRKPGGRWDTDRFRSARRTEACAAQPLARTASRQRHGAGRGCTTHQPESGGRRRTTANPPGRPVLRVSTGVGTRQHAAAGAAVWHRRGKPSALPRNQWLRVPVGAPVLRGAWRLGGGISQDLLAQPTHAAPDPLLALPGSGSRRMALGWIAPAGTEGLDSCTCQISAAAGSYRCVWIWSVRSGWCWQTGSGGGSTRVGQGRGRLDARATLSRRPKPARRGRAAGGCAGAGSCPEPVPDGTPAVLTGR